MNLHDYYKKHGTDGLVALAASVGSTLGYMQQLLYQPEKLPSIKMASKMVSASKGELTFEGLANPVRLIKS